MTKIITDKELGEIVQYAIRNSEIFEDRMYESFLADLASLVGEYFDATPGSAIYKPDSIMSRWSVAFLKNENTPASGGIFQRYDTDVDWSDSNE